jgi:uncharacterized membrane protein YGL010W
MRSFEQWMDEYGVDHTHPTNKLIHKFCVPLIMFSIIGILWSLPRWNSINWAFVLIIPALLFYVSLKKMVMLILMIIQTLLMCWISAVLYGQGVLLQVSITVFVFAWIGQFIGHKIEGRKPSFLQDISFLLIGPLWVNRFLLKKLGWKE